MRWGQRSAGTAACWRNAPSPPAWPCSLTPLHMLLPPLPQTQSRAAADPDQEARDAVATGGSAFRSCAHHVGCPPGQRMPACTTGNRASACQGGDCRLRHACTASNTRAPHPCPSAAELTKWAGEEAQRREVAKRQAMHYATGGCSCGCCMLAGAECLRVLHACGCCMLVGAALLTVPCPAGCACLAGADLLAVSVSAMGRV